MPPPAHESARQRGGHTSGNFIWSNDGEKLEVQYRGHVEFSEDDSDVTRLEPGGYLRLRDGRREIEVRADGSGSISRRFRIDESEQPFDPGGRAWLARVLPRFIRQTGLGAAARVARIYKARGARGVLAEIALIEGSFGKRIYFTELLTTPGLDAGTIEGPLRAPFFRAVSSIGSAFERGRALQAVARRGDTSEATLLEVIKGVDGMGNFEGAQVLLAVAAGRSPRNERR